MRNHTLFRSAVAASLGFALAACGSDSSTAPSRPPVSTVDVSALVAAASNGTYGSVARSVVLLPAVVTSPINTAKCPYSSSDQEFVCAPVTTNGITYKAAFQLLDANGHPLTVADAATLAAVRSITDIDGASSLVLATSGTVSVTTIHSHSDNTLSGLLTAKHVLNGTTTDRDTLSAVATGFTSKVAVTAMTTVANLDIPTTAGAYPATGTITSDATTTMAFNSTPPLASHTHAVVAFDGTSVVTITLGIGTATQRCTLDLAHVVGITCSAA